MTAGEIQVIMTCSECNEVHKLMVDSAGYLRHIRGEQLIQNALPMLSAADRELLISGICGKCFDAITADDGAFAADAGPDNEASA